MNTEVTFTILYETPHDAYTKRLTVEYEAAGEAARTLEVLVDDGLMDATFGNPEYFQHDKSNQNRFIARLAPEQYCDLLELPEKAPGDFLVYRILRLTDSKTYIGITARALEVRLKRHMADAFSRQRGKLGSLGNALRESMPSGKAFPEHFKAEVIASGLSQSAAGLREDDEIRKVPHSKRLNVLRGGRSFGSVANANCLLLPLDNGRWHLFTSLSQAVQYLNNHHPSKQANLEEGTVRRRIHQYGWSILQALGIKDRVDKRTLRDSFIYEGRTYNSIAACAEENNVSPVVIKSRIQRHRAKNNYDYSQTIKSDFGDELRLPDPDNLKKHISTNQFAKKTGLPISTVQDRYRRYRCRLVSQGHESKESVKKLFEYLLAYVDRKIHMVVTMFDGKALDGGLRESYRLYRSYCEKIGWQPVCSESWFKKNYRGSKYFARYGIHSIVLIKNPSGQGSE